MPKPGHIQLIVKQLVYPLRFVPRHGYHFRHGILREGDRSTSFIVVVETTGAEITSRRRETSCSLSTQRCFFWEGEGQVDFVVEERAECHDDVGEEGYGMIVVDVVIHSETNEQWSRMVENMKKSMKKKKYYRRCSSCPRMDVCSVAPGRSAGWVLRCRGFSRMFVGSGV